MIIRRLITGVAFSTISVGIGALPASAQSQLGQPQVITPANLGPAVNVPPPPPIAAAPSPSATNSPAPTAEPSPPPPGLVETPVPPADTAASQPNDVTQSVPDTAPQQPNNWVSGQTATLGMLDKVDGAVSTLSIPVGQSHDTGSLRVHVLACATRPPDAAPDTAIFVSVHNLKADESAQPLFRGWLLKSDPGAAIVADATDMFRVVGCK